MVYGRVDIYGRSPADVTALSAHRAPMLTRHGENGPVAHPLAARFSGVRALPGRVSGLASGCGGLPRSALSNDVRVSGPAESNGRAETVDGDAGVLSNLPRTRPQRSTARRTAARSQNARRASSENGSSGGASSTARAGKPRAAAKPAKAAGAKPAKAAKPGKPAKAKAAKATAKPGKRATAERPRKAAARRPLRVVRDEVPRQGFECDDDRATGAVPPPGGTELVSTAVEIVGELAKAGISGGERVLRDVLGLLGR